MRNATPAILQSIQSIAFFAVLATSANAQVQNAKPERIAGRVPNIRHVTQSMGFQFNVLFSDISYNGEVKNIEIVDQNEKEATVRVVFGKVNLQVNRTSVQGSRQQASCGPLTLVIGSRRDIIVDFQIQTNAGALKVVDAKFNLDRDNVQVGTPRWIQTKGFGMTQSRVASGLRSGLQSNVATVQRRLVAELPNIFRQIEDKIETPSESQDYPTFATL